MESRTGKMALAVSIGLFAVACEQGNDVTAPEPRLSVGPGQYDEAGNDVSVSLEDVTASASIQLASPPPIAGCLASTIQTLAVASHSGGGQTASGYGPEEGNDGVFGPGGDSPSACDFTWMSGGLYPSGAWYELDWASPQRLCQIWVDTKALPSECEANPNRGLHGADIQTWDGSNWVTHGSVTNATNDWGFVIPGCATTTKLRLFNVGPVSNTFQASNPLLYELKVYDCNNQPPDCSAAAASPDALWPPNHQFAPIDVVGVTDPDGDPVTITVDAIFQDEPTDTYGDGRFTPDGMGVGTTTAEVRAERAGTKKVPGIGRVYHIDFTADDGQGGQCSATVTVCVPHDQKDPMCVDDGALFDSTI